MRILVGNPKLTARQATSECSHNSQDSVCRVLLQKKKKLEWVYRREREKKQKKTKKLKIVVVKRTSSMEYWKVAKTHF